MRPKATLGNYKGVEAGRREASATDEEVDTELEAQREALASLENVDREAGKGDFVVLDFVGKVDGEPFEGGDARGYLLELGSERLIPGFEAQLEGAKAGDKREVKVTFPEDYGAEQLAGKEAVFETEVKEVKEKRLPDLDDDLAADAGGFDSLAEMRDEIASKITELKGQQLEGEFRENVVDAVAANATIDIPAELIASKAAEMWSQAARGLARRGIPPDQYLQMTGRTEEQLVEEAKPDAEKALRREAVLAAVIDAEGIEVSDDELLEALRTAATGADGSQPTDDGPAEDARARARAGPRPAAARGHRDAQGGRPAGRARDADPDRAAGGAREALDAREGGGREEVEALDARQCLEPGSTSYVWPAARSRSTSAPSIAVAGVSTPARSGSRSRSSARQSAASPNITAVAA